MTYDKARDQLDALAFALRNKPNEAHELLRLTVNHPDVHPTVRALVHDVLVDANDVHYGGGRQAPFQERASLADVAECVSEATGVDIDARHFGAAYERVRQADITTGLLAQMGTDADDPLPEPTRRDDIEAALDAHLEQQGDNGADS